MEIKKEEIKKIAVVNLGGIGDVLISTPALRALKNSYPLSQIYLLVVGRVKDAVKDLSYVDKVFVFDTAHPWAHGLVNVMNLMKLRMLNIDLAINMRTLVSERSARKIKFLLEVIHPRIKAGRDTSGRGGFLDIAIPEDDIGSQYTMEYDIELVERLGAQCIDRRIDFAIDEKSRRELREILQNYGIREADVVIGIHPGGKLSRRWPVDHFAGVIKKIQESCGAKFVITGDQDEAELGDRINKESGAGVINLAGKLTLSQLGALLARCALYITNDTGTMHVAAVLQTPLIAIFGSSHLKRFDPRNIFSQSVVLYKQTVCAPCNKFRCASMQCLKAVSPEEVAEAAIKLLRRRP
jgi:heptosyltransferase II